MFRTDATTTRMHVPSSDRARAARLWVRQAAYHLAADCDHLLDELSQLDRPGWTEMLTRTLVATRQLISVTGPGSASTTLFEGDLQPSARLVDAHRRVVTAATVSAAASIAPPGEEAMLAAIVSIHDAAAQMMSAVAEPSESLAPVAAPAT